MRFYRKMESIRNNRIFYNKNFFISKIICIFVPQNKGITPQNDKYDKHDENTF